MHTSNPARFYALVIRAVLVVAGLLAFLYNADFSSGEDVPRDAILGLLNVNGWHNVVHLATGALGLAVFTSLAASRAYALGLGVVYLMVASEDNVLHLLFGAVGVIAGLASSTRTASVSRAAA